VPCQHPWSQYNWNPNHKNKSSIPPLLIVVVATAGTAAAAAVVGAETSCVGRCDATAAATAVVATSVAAATAEVVAPPDTNDAGVQRMAIADEQKSW